MQDNNIVKDEDLKNISENTEPQTEENSELQSADALKTELEKLRENYENQKIRAEKAEAKLKQFDKTSSSKENLPSKDLIALMKADIDEDMIEEVLDYSKYKKISVSEALNSPIIKSAIQQKKEFAKSNEASITNNQRRGSAKLTDEQLLENARKGIFPESDDDINRLIKLKLTKK